jgi:hypothetical protein
MMIQQRTFSARNSKVGAKDHTDSLSVSMRPSEQQSALQQRRYKHRRASEPLNLLAGIGSLGGWTRGSGQRKKSVKVFYNFFFFIIFFYKEYFY